jgi:aminoglycoside phosphotransferase (APT) family kinase protein
VRDPGRLLASGRDSDIFEYGPGLVLRRSRGGHSMEHEARIMTFVRAQGYPVPEVHELSDDGLDLVMERIDGPEMVSVLGSQPWTLRRNAAVLARLHHQLHQITAPEWMPPSPEPCGAGDRLIHFDLHPLNVLLAKSGPVVIDWPNARRGNPATDVALTWVLLAAGEIPGDGVMAKVIGTFRSFFVNSFLKHFDLEPVRAELRATVNWKVTDPNMSDAEIARMRALAEQHGR